jgi:hypothetical protein
MWAFKAAKFSYLWMVGNERSVKFWEDRGFRGTSLAIHFLELYVICNKQNKPISDILGDGELKLSFRRNFNQRMFWMWEDLVVIVQDRVLFAWGEKILWGRAT